MGTFGIAFLNLLVWFSGLETPVSIFPLFQQNSWELNCFNKSNKIIKHSQFSNFFKKNILHFPPFIHPLFVHPKYQNPPHSQKWLWDEQCCTTSPPLVLLLACESTVKLGWFFYLWSSECKPGCKAVMNLTSCHCAPFHVPNIYFLGSGGKQVKGDGEHAGRAEFQLVLLNKCIRAIAVEAGTQYPQTLHSPKPLIMACEA